MPSQAAIANFIYDLLVREGGAPSTDSMRQQFIWWFSDANRIGSEYRIGGQFGAGFKFWRRESSDGEIFYVNQYPEDETSFSKNSIEIVNASLNYLKDKIKAEQDAENVMASITSPNGIFARLGVENIVFESPNANEADIVIPIRRLDDIE